jgi:hypothetical protein
MVEAKRKSADRSENNLELDGFDQFFDEQASTASDLVHATVTGDPYMSGKVDKLLERFTELIGLIVDQRVETSKIASQLIDNQRQLVATQQILIRLMERSIELTRHITAIEEKLPTVFELPRIVDCIKDRLIQLEGIELH